ncbi:MULTISPECIES: META domain-containing protein [unclassified Meridianimarinicoccus]|uniref:META domain-containing protein n=1 Tax=unclassified Meridianimarinicoccus TaxID=2923344 RepID=UPI0018682534|nr:META domain-containing protein [Fluviibacterium sp. MJW13]
MIDGAGRYAVTFSDDGSCALQADSNRTTGTWALEDTQLVLESGPATLALCPPPSLGDAFARMMTASNVFEFDGDNLVVRVEDPTYRVIQLESAGAAR